MIVSGAEAVDSAGWGLARETHSLDDLEEDYAQKAVDLGAFLVCSAHLALHSFGESTRGLECASDDEDACEEKPEVSMIGRERV